MNIRTAVLKLLTDVGYLALVSFLLHHKSPLALAYAHTFSSYGFIFIPQDYFLMEGF